MSLDRLVVKAAESVEVSDLKDEAAQFRRGEILVKEFALFEVLSVEILQNAAIE